MLKTKLPPAITTVEEAKAFLSDLHNNGEEYHCEDDAGDCLAECGITPEEAIHCNKLMKEIYCLPGNEDSNNMAIDPCGFLIDLRGGLFE